MSNPSAPGIPGRHTRLQTLGPQHLAQSIRRHRFVYEPFDTEPMCQLKGSGGGAPTGATGDENLINTGHNIFEYHILGAAQTIVEPNLVAGGLDVALDLTDNEGMEMCFGGILASNNVMTVGTDPDFYARLRWAIADVSGTDDCAFGFRKVEAYQAALDDYDEMAVLNVISGNINVETILNNATTVTTDTTSNWADTETHELEIRVVGRAAQYLIDGVPVEGVPAFSFDSGEVVTPFFHFLHATTSPGAMTLKQFEYGYLAERPDELLGAAFSVD